MTTYSRVILKKGKEEPVKRFHPWIFSGAIDKIDGPFKEGDLVEVFSANDKYLATGYLLSGSIAVKLFNFNRQEISGDFWKVKFLNALKLRTGIGLAGSATNSAFRLIHNEGDGFPGLIVDIYGKLAVMQSHSVGMYQLREVFASIIMGIFEGRISAVYDKSSESLKKMTGFQVDDGFIFGDGEDFEILENGQKFIVNPVKGQKTGFFLDQRENRLLLTRYSQGRKVLNMFGYTGGFSVYAASAGADQVTTVDSSGQAIALSGRNLLLNGFNPSKHQCLVSDAKDFLDKSADGSYDVIILDPPAFAKNIESRQKALNGYININALALKKIQKGGILFTFSCSQVVDRKMFHSAITAAAIQAGRGVRVLHQLSQPPDHPINIFHQEGEYLKGLVLQVE
jgi:23S rRNA (cytosine1962-C5)-methyltransferase